MNSTSTGMSWLKALAVSALICVTALSASDTRADSTSFLIQVLPHGSVVELNGPQSLVAASPNKLPRPQPGWYQITASHPGYETWKGKLQITPTTPELFSMSLKAKTRMKAALRAIAFPGWGHYYSERKGRGVLITIAAIGAAGGYLYLDNRLDSKMSTYDNLQHDFENAQSLDEARRLKPLVEDARKKAYDAETDRRNWGIAALAFYAYQVVDAVIFFPETPDFKIQGVQFGVTSDHGRRLMLGATYDF